MWGEIQDQKVCLEKAIKFTGNHNEYGKYMLRVVHEWKFSCENALTDRNLNRRAWVGHAACALALNCPEHITRQAWSFLTDEQRFLANKEADRAIRVWEHNYRKSKNIRKDVGGQMLFGWNS